MAAPRTTIAVRQDLKVQFDRMHQMFETKLGLPKGSLSPQVFLYSAAGLGLNFLDALEVAQRKPAGGVDFAKIPQHAALALEKVKSDTMLLQLVIAQEETADRIRNQQAAVGAAIALAILAIGAAAMVGKGTNRVT